MTSPYRGRFAPTPSGPLHAGSVVAALGSWLDARAHRGQWLVRIEDTDTPRCIPGADHFILHQLDALGLVPDEPVQWQSHRTVLYQSALDQLREERGAYGCACSRQDVEQALAAAGHPARNRHAVSVYPGTCRLGTRGLPVRAWRVLVDSAEAVTWHDRRLGAQQQHLQREVGDFVIRRADGLWAYQLAVVVDDAQQGITHVVRGEDLADNTPRQMHLQKLLRLPTPVYLHTDLVRAADGQKLSKQTGAQAANTEQPLTTLREAARVLDLDVPSIDRTAGLEGVIGNSPGAAELSRWLQAATAAWGLRWCTTAA